MHRGESLLTSSLSHLTVQTPLPDHPEVGPSANIACIPSEHRSWSPTSTRAVAVCLSGHSMTPNLRIRLSNFAPGLHQLPLRSGTAGFATASSPPSAGGILQPGAYPSGGGNQSKTPAPVPRGALSRRRGDADRGVARDLRAGGGGSAAAVAACGSPIASGRRREYARGRGACSSPEPATPRREQNQGSNFR
jgi:hypothetical protein